MNSNHLNIPPAEDTDLRALVQPLAEYLAAVGQRRVALVLVLVLLQDILLEIDEAANEYLDTVTKIGVG